VACQPHNVELADDVGDSAMGVKNCSAVHDAPIVPEENVADGRLDRLVQVRLINEPLVFAAWIGALSVGIRATFCFLNQGTATRAPIT
jgi:hypothetical protein